MSPLPDKKASSGDSVVGTELQHLNSDVNVNDENENAVKTDSSEKPNQETVLNIPTDIKGKNAASLPAQKVGAVKKSKPPRTLAEAFEDTENPDESFFLFKKMLSRTRCDHFFEPDGVSITLKKPTTLFDKLGDKNFSLFEHILASGDNKSAKFISLIWEEFELWKQESVLTVIPESSKKLPIQHVIDSKNHRSLLSFLVFDWHNPDQHYTNTRKSYYLELKNKQLIDIYGESLFQKLYEIIDTGKYQDVCLRIIYEYLNELEQRKERESISDEVTSEEENDDNFSKLVAIDVLEEMKNEEYKNQIFAILLTYWKTLDCCILPHFKTKAEEEQKKMSNKEKVNFKPEITFVSLSLQLIHREHNKFEKDFEDFIVNTKRAYGHYYETVAKPAARLLLKIVETQRMSQVETFIFNKCPYLEINSTPLTNFQELYKYNNKNIFPFTPKEKELFGKMEKAFTDMKKTTEKGEQEITAASLEAFRKCYKLTAHKDVDKSGICFSREFSTTRNLLFEHEGRPGDSSKSLFEEILGTKGMAPLIHVVWDEFELWRKEKILNMTNPEGKLLIKFAINSGDDENLIAFLMPSTGDSESMVNKKYFMRMQSEQFFQETAKTEKTGTGKTLFEHYLFIQENKTRDKFFEICFYLFEEMDVIHDIKRDTCIDLALILSKIDSYSKDIKEVKEKNDRKIVQELLDSPKVKTLLEFIQPSKTAKYDHEYDCDRILKYFAAFWTKTDKNYEKYKTKLIDHSPFFAMATFILEGEQQKFKDNFHASIDELVKSYKRYKMPSNNMKMMQEDLFILFRAAIKNDQKQIIDCILKYESFESLKFNFPQYKKANEKNHFAAMKLLEVGYNLGKKKIPDDWVTEQFLKEFVDSQVKDFDQDTIQMNSNFLLHEFDRKFKIKSKKDVDNEMLFNEYTGTLSYLLDNQALDSLIMHPIISTYINLKSYKYRKTYVLNFILFVFLYMLPFGLLIVHHSFDNENNKILMYVKDSLQVLCIVSSSLLTLRELAQLIWVAPSGKNYLKDKSNLIELLMIALSWIMLVVIFFLNIEEHLEIFSFVSTLFIIVSTVVLLTMLPFKSVPIYMMMLKKVAATFMKFSCFFVYILVAFSVSFCVIFRSKSNNKSANNATDDEITEKEENDDDDDDVQQNFDTIPGSFLKTILMLSGEFTIEPFTLSPTQMVIFFIFVVTSFILFNLILGLAIDDVQRLRNEAEHLELKYEAETFITSARKWWEIHDKLTANGDGILIIEKLVWWKRLPMRTVRWSIINYCFIHKIGKMYVNKKTREVTFEVNRKQEAALTMNSGGVERYFMEQPAFDRLQDILTERQAKKFAEVKQEIENKVDNVVLKDQLDKLTELFNQQYNKK